MTVMLGEFMLLSRFTHINVSKNLEVQHLTFPLAFLTVKCEQKNIVDRLADCRTTIDYEHARHRLSGAHSVVGKCGHRGNVVREQHSTGFRRRCQNRRIVGC